MDSARATLHRRLSGLVCVLGPSRVHAARAAGLDAFTVPEELAVRVAPATMRRATEQIFETLGLRAEDAATAADALLFADTRGIDSHGVSNMMRHYVSALEGHPAPGTAGTPINPAPTWRVEREAAAVATIDSDWGLGLVMGPRAMQLAVEKAQACGVGVVVVNTGSHYGCASYHAARAAEKGCIGISMTIGGRLVAPTHGAAAQVGLNPIAVAIPCCGKNPQFVFDASMSSVAGNKITLARRLGAAVPGGIVAKEDGEPIMEEGLVPEKFMMLPTGGTREIGSHKGYGLAAAVDILSGILPGAGPAMAMAGVAGGWHGNESKGIGHLFMALRIDAFTDPERFEEDVDAYLTALRATSPAAGHERVVYAGVGASEVAADRFANGIPYHPEVISWYSGTLARLGLPSHFDGLDMKGWTSTSATKEYSLQIKGRKS